MKPTIYEIKEATKEHAPYYFDRKTMKTFGQTMKSFSVNETKTKGVYEIRARNKYGNISQRWYAVGFSSLYLSEESAIEAINTGIDPYLSARS